MDVGIINPFLEATLDVTSSMAQLTVVIGAPALKHGKIAQGEVTGYIELNGPLYIGSLAISFSKAALLLIYERMLGENLSELDDSTVDLAGEITNMVCGGAKKRLAEKGYQFSLSRPKLLTGQQHEIQHQGPGPVITLPLQLGDGEMFIEVCLNH